MKRDKIRSQRYWFSPSHKQSFSLGFTMISLVIVLLLTYAAYSRNEFWQQDELGIWENIVKKSPMKFRPHYNLSKEYDKRQRFAEAERELLTAISLEPDNARAHNNLARIYGKQNRIEEGIEELKIAIRLDPNYYLALRNLQAGYESLGEFDKAEMARKKADAIYHYEQGRLLAKQGLLRDAIRELQISIILNPDNDAANRELGVLRGEGNIGSDVEQ